MIDNTFTFQEIIGFGGSSKVFRATDYQDNLFAIKAIRKDKGYQSEVESMMVLREFMVMEHIGEHPNIIKHYSCNPEGILEANDQSQPLCYNVMEYCEKGPLSSIIKRTGPLEEIVWRFIFIQIANAVKHLHDRKFAHLDIKLENILLDKLFNAKIADFGSGVSLIKTKGLTDHKVGTPLYMAPEIKQLSKGEFFQGMKADIYSLGVSLWLMLLGELPDHQMFAYEKSTVGSFELSDEENIYFEAEESSKYSKTEFLSNGCKELLAQMMDEDPNNRPTIDQILEHEWMTSKTDEDIAETVYLEMLARSDFITMSKSS